MFVLILLKLKTELLLCSSAFVLYIFSDFKVVVMMFKVGDGDMD